MIIIIIISCPPVRSGQRLEALATDLNVLVSHFEPLETGGEDALKSDYYLLIMRQNAENLKSAFTGSTQSWRPSWRSASATIW